MKIILIISIVSHNLAATQIVVTKINPSTRSGARSLALPGAYLLLRGRRNPNIFRKSQGKTPMSLWFMILIAYNHS